MIKSIIIKAILTLTITTTVNTATADKYSYRDDIYMMTSEHGSRVWMQTNGTSEIWDDTIFDFDDSFELDMMEEFKHGAYSLYGYGFHYMMYGWGTASLSDDIIADAEHGY